MRPFGKGGMGRVWHGKLPDGSDVAVKVLLSKYATEARFQDAFRFEVRSVASLDHPGIVQVFDYGIVPTATAQASGGQLLANTPWLAMEFAAGASLVDHGMPTTWPGVRDLLLQVLDGLGHSHAHGIVHRDLKPRNVLLHPREGSPRVSLTDFGIAHALNALSPSHGGAGTPAYMAPEQVRGSTAQFGPWTDLYALGCLAFRLVAGHAPFRGPKTAVVLAHVKNPAPPLPEADFAVPAGFPGWVARLLEKRPSRRFQRAADAAHALSNIEWEDAGTDLPPIPRAWRPDPALARERPKGTGLALFILRPWPLVGRDATMQVIWESLRQAAAQGKAGGVLIAGGVGNGKSRVLEALAERAHETGAAIVLRARAQRDRDSALVDAVRTLLGLRELANEDAKSHLHAWLLERGAARAEEVARRWVALLYPSAQTLGGTAIVPITDEAERLSTWIDIIDQLTQERPVLLAIDDVHLDDEAFALAVRLVDTDRPVLVACTLRPDELNATWHQQVEAWARGPSVLRLDLGPLTDASQRELVDAGVGLTARLAEALVERTNGNPLFAVRIVRDWVRAGSLIPTTTGFALRQGSKLSLPGSIADHFVSRLAPLEAVHPGATRVLEVLACLGSNRVRQSEWQAACEEAAVPTSADVEAAIEATGLATCDRDPKGPRWALDHALLRTSLMNAVRLDGRHVELQRACARALARSSRAGSRDRSALHLANAGDTCSAMRSLEALIAEAQRRSQHRRLLALLDLQDRCLDDQQLTEHDPQRIRGLALRAWAQLALEASDEAHAAATRAWKLARQTSSPALKALVSRILVEAEHQVGRLVPDLPLLDTAEAMQQAAHDPRGASIVKRWRAEAHRLRGDFKTAERHFRDAWHHAREAGAALEEARALAGLGEMLGHQRRFDDAEPRFREAQALYATLGNRTAVAQLEAVLSKLARACDDPIQALSRARKARDELVAMRANTWFADLQLGLAHLVRGELNQARGELEELVSRAGRSPHLMLIARGALLALAASRRDWDGWDLHMAAWKGLANDERSVEPDSAWPVEWAARRAGDAREWDRATGAYGLARHRYALLGDMESIARIDKRVAALERDR